MTAWLPGIIISDCLLAMELFTGALNSNENCSYNFFKILKMHIHKTMFSRYQIRSLKIARMQHFALFTPYPGCRNHRLNVLLAPNIFSLGANWLLGQKCYFEAWIYFLSSHYDGHPFFILHIS